MLNNFRTIEIVWDKATSKIANVIRLASTDHNGRALAVNIRDRGIVPDLSGSILRMYWQTKSGNNDGYIDFPVDKSDIGFFKVDFPSAMLAHVGFIDVNLHLHLPDDSFITSETFEVEVFKGINTQSIESSNEFSALENLFVSIKGLENIVIELEEEVSYNESVRNDNEELRKSNEATRIESEEGRVASEGNRSSSEEVRKINEDIRESNESSRKLKETERESNELERTTNEDIRVSSESERVTSEEERGLSELSRSEQENHRESKESSRELNESVRVSNEDARIQSETNREQNEESRKSNESQRESQEQDRLSQEVVRSNSENERKLSESERRQGEDSRISAENVRKQEELDRNKNESLRTSNEDNRKSEEVIRISNEENRKASETLREEFFNLLQGKLDSGELDGKSLEFNWSGTELGVKKEGSPNYIYIDLKGDTGEIENLDSSHIVDALGYIPISATDVPDSTWENLKNKPTEFNPTSHTHGWSEVTNKPSSFTPSTHTHSINDITGLRDELDSVPELTKENVGLGNVDNVKQASKVEHDQLASDFSAHHAEKVYQGEVHGMRVVDDKFEFFNGTEWVELKGGGGSSVRLGNVLDLTIEPLVGNKIKITWADPEDVVLEGITLAQWKGTQLRKKLNTYPIDEKDGELITNNIVRNQYIDGYLDEDLSSGQRYYYALFPYTLDDVYTIDVANRVDVIAFEKYEQSPPIKPVVGNLGALKATVSSDVGSVVSLDKVDWFASPHEFVDLVENEVYTPYAKFEETSDKWESIIVHGDTFVAINKLPQNPPPAPSISNLEFNKVTVTGISGTEVRLGSGEWLDSPQTFTGLIAETTYQVYARMKETEDKFPSDSSVVKSFTTPSELRLYGFEIDETNSNPKTAVTYIEDAIGMTPASGNNGNFNWGSWEPFIQEISKPVVMKAGVDQYDLNYDDYTKKATGGNSTLTGADGDVFTKLQHLHMKHEKITNGHRWLLASKPFDGSFSMTEELENGYNQFNNPILVTLQNLYLLIFKDRDSQTALGRGRVDGAGYIESGNTNSKGYMFGSTQDLQIKFLGIEDFWGNKFQWVDGLMSDGNRDILHGTGNFNDTGSGYSKQATSATANVAGYSMKVQGGKGGYVPADSSASETTGYADYGGLTASRLAFFGGNRANGSQAGAFHVRLNDSASTSSASLSARLCYKNADAVYIGAYLGFEQSGKLRSISGNMPTDTRTISQFRTLAKANN